jgi:hypothetical protein
MTQRNLPACYNSRVGFQAKGEEKKYMKTFGYGDRGQQMLEYTTDVNEAKLFRSHVGWTSLDPDFDNYHVAMDFFRTFFCMNGAYRTAVGCENFAEPDGSVQFITESLEGKPRLTFVLMKTET